MNNEFNAGISSEKTQILDMFMKQETEETFGSRAIIIIQLVREALMGTIK